MNAAVVQHGEKMVAITRAAGLTATGLKDLLLHVEEAAPSAEQQARIRVILDGLGNLALADGRKLLTETVKLVKDKESAEYRTIKVKASEARSIFGAVRLVKGFREQAEKLGWHKAVTESRNVLIEHHLKADGGAILTEEQAKAKAEAEAESNAIKELAERRKRGEQVAVSEEEVKKILESAHQQEYLNAIKEQAERLIKAKGTDYALKLAQELIAQCEAQPEQQAAVS